MSLVWEKKGMDNDNQSLIGTMLDRYKIEQLIGQGGLGAVFLATDETLQRRVAVKVLQRIVEDTHDFLERFRLQASVMAGFNHPNVVPIYDYGVYSNRGYLVTPFY